MISKSERTELRSMVRGQFRVLRAEVEQREAEVLADADQQIADKYASEDHAYERAAFLANEAVLEANRRVNDILREHLESHIEYQYVQLHFPRQPQKRRLDLRGAAVSKIRAQVKSALLILDRQEADLLRQLAIGALESEEAHAFLTAIPTVGQLVPLARLSALEASLGPDRPVGGS